MNAPSMVLVLGILLSASAGVQSQPAGREAGSAGAQVTNPSAFRLQMSETARRAEAVAVRQRLARSTTLGAAFWMDVQRLEDLGPAEVRIAVEQGPGVWAITPYKRVGDWAVAEDERILGPFDRVVAEQAVLRRPAPAMTTFALVPEDRSLWWPSAPIPFEIDPALETVGQVAIRAALADYERLTPVRFRPRQEGDSAYIRYVKQLECCGPFGHLSSMTDHTGRRNGENVVKVQTRTREGTLVDGALLRRSALHETGHMLGLHHEHNRPDRDRFVRVDDACLDFWYGVAGNFAIEPDSERIGPYDFDSIMHYPSRDGEKGPPWDREACTTMVRRSDGSRILASAALSRHDINALHHIYGRSGVRGQRGDHFGFRMLTHDFDADGYVDLAVGVPGRADRRGSVHLYKGTGSGFVLWKVLRPRDGQDGESFGWSLAAGDFNSDGVQDLAVGAPRATVDGKAQAGRVHLFRIRSDASGEAFDVLTKPSSAGPIEVMDRFGFALEAGQFVDGAPRGLVIGAPGARSPNGQRGGRVWFQVQGLLDPITEVLVNGAPAARFGQMGFALTKLSGRIGMATAGLDTLVVAAPGVTLGGCGDPLVYTTRPRPGGLQTDAVLRQPDAASPAFCPQDPDLSDALDRFPNPVWDAGFGAEMASGDFNGDGLPDLAIAGGRQVHPLFREVGGSWVARPPLRRPNEASFGSSLAVADLNQDGRDDLLVGVPQQAVDGQPGAGAVQAFHGCRVPSRTCRSGLRAAFRVTQDDALEVPVPGQAQPVAISVSSSRAGDRFGNALVAWSVPGENRSMFAVGSPGKSFTDESRAGAAFLFLPSLTGGTPYRNAAGLNQRFETRLDRR